MTLSQAKMGDLLRVVAVDSAQAEIGERLCALGIFPGVDLQLLHRAPLGDPLQVKAGRTLVSIRRREADFVSVALAAGYEAVS